MFARIVRAGKCIKLDTMLWIIDLKQRINLNGRWSGSSGVQTTIVCRLSVIRRGGIINASEVCPELISRTFQNRKIRDIVRFAVSQPQAA